MKSKITHVIILVITIVVVSILAISIKNVFSKSALDSLSDNELAAGLVSIGTGDNDIAQGEEEKINVEKGAIAVIDIPSVKIRGQVAVGTDDYTLKNYIGKFKDCAYPGEAGNFSVAAHNNIHTEIFRDLHKVNIGDKVRVITTDKEYVYEVTSKEKIQPTQIEVLDEDKSKHEITLITCSDMSRTRIVVKGNLVSTRNL